MKTGFLDLSWSNDTKNKSHFNSGKDFIFASENSSSEAIKYSGFLIAFYCRCTCGGCDDSLLVGAREFRCCKEILEATGKFTYEGMNAACILSHHDFAPLTNRTVLLQVGPLLRDKSGKRYQKSGHTENE